MKHYIFVFLILCSLFSLMLSPCANAKISLSTGLRYDMFSDDRSPETMGYEFTTPIGLTYRGTQFALSLDTAYSHASLHAGVDLNAGLSSMTDVRISASYGLPNLSVGLVFGVNTNLPVGKE